MNATRIEAGGINADAVTADKVTAASMTAAGMTADRMGVAGMGASAMSASRLRASHLLVLVTLELRLRLRRPGTLVALLGVVALSWLMIPDPASGKALMVVHHARVLYSSTTLALGGSMLAAMLFGLAGFYLLRGRAGEDLRGGVGAVISASAISNAAFLFSRWLGGVLYLCALMGAYMLTIVLMQLLRGDGPIELLVYARVGLMLLLPLALYMSACAILFDSIPLLMGKGGDVLYFFLWVAQTGLLAAFDKVPLHGVSPLLLLDMNGVGALMLTLKSMLMQTSMAIGRNGYDVALAALPMPPLAWPDGLPALRAGAALLAMLLLAPAIAGFHRYSPDRVKAAMSRRRRSPLAWLNGLLRPLTVLVQPLWRLAPRVPGVAGQALGDIALTLVMAPSTLLLMPVAWVLAAALPPAQVPSLLIPALAVWGLLISDVSTRDIEAGSEAMGGAVAGGATGRYLRQLLAAAGLGLLVMGPVALRLLAFAPLRAAVLVSGVICLAALAQVFGRCARTPRLFVALFLFVLYLAVNAPSIAWLDMVGFNGSATSASMLLQSVLALCAIAAGWLHARWRG